MSGPKSHRVKVMIWSGRLEQTDICGVRRGSAVLRQRYFAGERISTQSVKNSLSAQAESGISDSRGLIEVRHVPACWIIPPLGTA